MTYNEAALFQAMQEHGFSTGCCTVTLHLLSGHNDAVNTMLLILTDKPHMRENRFVEELANICRDYGIDKESLSM
ncbi:MAG: hypothetical protein J6N56_05505 [Bacteroidales bacterium]|nr:hypothetical protein [Bacteroidales bacterium]